MTSSTEKQIIAKLILLNISRGKCSQTMKLSQLLEQNMRNIFLKKTCKKWGRETNSRPLYFLKKEDKRKWLAS